jgi:hypothetical protein
VGSNFVASATEYELATMQAFAASAGAAVPEPATLALLGLGAIGILSSRSRRRDS